MTVREGFFTKIHSFQFWKIYNYIVITKYNPSIKKTMSNRNNRIQHQLTGEKEDSLV